MCPVDAKVEEAVRARNAENWKCSGGSSVCAMGSHAKAKEEEETVLLGKCGEKGCGTGYGHVV